MRPHPLRTSRARIAPAAESAFIAVPTVNREPQGAVDPHPRSTCRSLLPRLLALALLLLAAPLHGQAVRGRVVEAETGAPVPGAILRLRDANGRSVAAVLSDAAGRYHLAAPSAGSWQLRVERVGFASAAPVTLRLQAGQTLEHEVRAESRRVVLEPVVANGSRRDCTVRPRDGDATARVWDEARKALTAAALTADEARYTYTRRVYRRTLRLDDLGVTAEESWTEAGAGAEPFAATPIARLASAGFVVPDRDSIEFHAPDARTLLSDEFLDGHCFSLRDGEGDRAGLVGLEFAPVRGQTRPDVHGILWLDRGTARLRWLEFVYTGVEWMGEVQHLGGRVDLEPMEDGGWIVRRWYIRMPAFTRDARVVTVEHPATLTGLVERGGEVLRIGRGGRFAARTRTALQGTVVDTLTGAPLAGARVELEGTGAAAVTDSLGRFVMAEVAPGAGWLRVVHPALDTLQLAPPRVPVDLPAGMEARRDVRLPRPEHLLARACEGFPGVPLVGWVRPVGRRMVMAGASAWAEWSVEGERVRAHVLTDERGVFTFCGLPPGADVLLSTMWLGRREQRRLRLPASGPVAAAVEMPVLNWMARRRPRHPYGEVGPPTRVFGRVRDVRRRPLRGAVVRIGAEHPPITTPRDGTFESADLPAGEYDLTVERPGQPPYTLHVVLRRGTSLEVNVRLPSTR